MNKKILSSFTMIPLLIVPIFSTITTEKIAHANNSLDNITSNSNFTISKEMTRKELIEHYAKENNVSFTKAEFELFKGSIQERAGYKYRTFSRGIGHGAYMEIYTQGDGWNSYYSIDRILNVSVKHSSKSFVGTVYTNLESNSSIYYDVEGNLHNQGTTTVSGGLNIGVGQGGSVNLGASYSSGIYAHISTSGRLSF